MIQNSKSLSKLLDIQRVSAASLSAQAMAGWTFERRNGVQMVWTDSAVPLVVAPPPIDPAVARRHGEAAAGPRSPQS